VPQDEDDFPDDDDDDIDADILPTQDEGHPYIEKVELDNFMGYVES
jgi:hypothetical protein